MAKVLTHAAPIIYLACLIAFSPYMVFGQVTAVVNFGSGSIGSPPRIASRDVVTVRLEGINPVSYDYEISLTEVDPFKFIEGKIPPWLQPYVQRSEGTKGEDPNLVIKDIRFFPVAEQDVHDMDRLTQALTILTTRLNDAEKTIRSGKDAAAGAASKEQNETDKIAALAKAEEKEADNAAAFATARERLEEYRKILSATYARTLTQTEAGLFGKFIEVEVREQTSSKWIDDLKQLGATTDCSVPCLSNNEKMALATYLDSKTVRKFRLRVEPVLPVDLTLGGGWTNTNRRSFDTVVDPTSGKTIIRQTNGDNSFPLVFASHAITGNLSRGIKLHLGIGTNLNNPGIFRVAAIGFTLNDRAIVLIGWGRSKSQRLVGGQVVDAEVPAGSQVATGDATSDGLFLGFSVHLNQ